MRANEEKIEDVRGRYCRADPGSEADDPAWTEARFIITSERIIVFDVDGTRENVPLAAVEAIDTPSGLGVADPVADATALALEETVLVIVTEFRRAFEAYLQQAALDRRTVRLAEEIPPDEDAWIEARMFVAQRRLQLAATDGVERAVSPDDVHDVTTTARTIEGEDYRTNRIVHDSDERETQIAVPATLQPFLDRFLTGADD
jgi:hypothetical protein